MKSDRASAAPPPEVLPVGSFRSLVHQSLDRVLDRHPEAEEAVNDILGLLDTKGVDVIRGVTAAVETARMIFPGHPESGPDGSCH